MTTISDRQCKLHYLNILCKAIKLERKFGFETSDLSIDDLTVIEYELKDGAKRAVSNELSQEECAHIFIQRVKRLSKGDREEWTFFKERVTRCAKVLTSEQIMDLDLLARECQKSKV